MGFDKAIRKQAESRLNEVVFEAEVQRLIRQEVGKLIAASCEFSPVKWQAIANLNEEKKGTEKLTGPSSSP